MNRLKLVLGIISVLFPGVVFGAPRETVAHSQPLGVTPSVEPSGLSATTASPTMAPKTTTKLAPMDTSELKDVRLPESGNRRGAQHKIVRAVSEPRAKPIGGVFRLVRVLFKHP